MQTETSRIEAFSDGVFAIAITLLILEIKVPHRDQGSLAAGLLHQWPSYLAFLLSFAYIGIMWINHHRMFTHIKRSNDVLLILNLLLLLGVTAVPFPTAVLAEHLGGPDQRTAALIYNATFVVIALAFNLLWRYAVSRRLLHEHPVRGLAANISSQYAVGPFLYLACFVIAWFNVRASVIANTALALFFVLPPSLMKRGTSAARP
ncbi:MAG TPA: TMEM175 family protein [Candidatus Angelobacter sp.]